MQAFLSLIFFWGHREEGLGTRLVEGLIDGQKISDMLCDSGANISMISKHLIPKEPKYCGYVVVGSVGEHLQSHSGVYPPSCLVKHFSFS